jgi:hypothetical protein
MERFVIAAELAILAVMIAVFAVWQSGVDPDARLGSGSSDQYMVAATTTGPALDLLGRGEIGGVDLGW